MREALRSWSLEGSLRVESEEVRSPACGPRTARRGRRPRASSLCRCAANAALERFEERWQDIERGHEGQHVADDVVRLCGDGGHGRRREANEIDEERQKPADGQGRALAQMHGGSLEDVDACLGERRVRREQVVAQARPAACECSSSHKHIDHTLERAGRARVRIR
jgi:hypothetical protein